MSRPEPRPALQRADDGLVHPAAPRAATEPPASSSHRFTGKPATLSVVIPKDLRKATRRLAEREGVTVDAVVAAALASYVTGG